MKIYLDLSYKNPTGEYLIPSTITLEIDGVKYVCTWDESMHGFSVPKKQSTHSLKGVLVCEAGTTNEKYGNGLLRRDSSVKFLDITYEETETEDEIVADIVSLVVEDGPVENIVIDKDIEWPFNYYMEGYNARFLKPGDAIKVVIRKKDGFIEGNAIVQETDADSLTVEGFNGLIKFTYTLKRCEHDITWKFCHPSSGEIDYPLRSFCFAEAVWQYEDITKEKASEHYALVRRIADNLFEAETFTDSEISRQITKETIEDYEKYGII